MYQPLKETKISVLNKSRSILPALLASGKLDCTPIMWHGGLREQKIFVDPDNPAQITGIIDWQATRLGPMCVQVRHPDFLDLEGPVPEGYGEIELPSNYDQMSSDEQLAARKLKTAQSLFKLYELQHGVDNKTIYNALKARDTLPGCMASLIGSIANDGETVLEGMLISLAKNWNVATGFSDKVPNPMPCPLAFSEQDISMHHRRQQEWNRSNDLMEELISELGVYRCWDGWINHNAYPAAPAILERAREAFIARHITNGGSRSDWEAAWPFQEA